MVWNSIQIAVRSRITDTHLLQLYSHTTQAPISTTQDANSASAALHASPCAALRPRYSLSTFIYLRGSEAAKEAISLSALAREVGMHDDSPVNMSMDNRSAIDVAYNPEHFGRMKHVARRHFFVRECVENHLIRVPFVRTDANDADFFTKVLPARKFFPLRDKIMNVPPHLSALGRGVRILLA